jgi:hypothetical protein
MPLTRAVADQNRDRCQFAEESSCETKALIIRQAGCLPAGLVMVIETSLRKDAA